MEVTMAAIASGPLAERLLEEINAKEDLSLRLGDALDIKASIGLAVILFLATQNAYFLEKSLPKITVWVQFVSIGCVAIAALFALWELWPRMYILPQPESPIVTDRIEQLNQHYGSYPNTEENVRQALLQDEIRWATGRIADNQKKNGWKSALLNWSFWLTGIAVVLNLLTVLTMAIRSIS
jgi:hypothetical protein